MFHVTGHRLRTLIDMNVLDAEELKASVSKPPVGLHLRSERLRKPGTCAGNRQYPPFP